MDETNFAYFDALDASTQSSPNVYTILESRKRNDVKPSKISKEDKYLKKSTVFLTIFLIINVATISCIGCGVIVYLISSKNTECKLILPSNFAFSENQVQQPEFTSGKLHGGPTGVSIVRPSKISIVSQECRGQWVTSGKLCYFFSNESVTWLTALVRCQSQGGYLAEANTAVKDQFLRGHAELIKSTDCYQKRSDKYRGRKQTTYDGHKCQRWDSQSPHIHTRNKTETFPDKSLADASNYCRDPDGEGFPWCYTTDPKVRWQHCGIYSCSGGDFWIGLVTLEGKWKWMNRRTEASGFTHWAEGKPTKGMCGYIVGTQGFTWDAQSCELPAMYICEKSSTTKYPTLNFVDVCIHNKAKVHAL